MQETVLRLLVVESTPLANAKAPRLEAAQQAERAALGTLQQQWQRRTCAGEAEAHQAAALCLRELSVHQHHLTDTVGVEGRPEKRATRGPPPKDAPRPRRQVWRVHWQVHEATEAIAAQIQRERRFGLATNVLDAQQLSDAEVLKA